MKDIIYELYEIVYSGRATRAEKVVYGKHIKVYRIGNLVRIDITEIRE